MHQCTHAASAKEDERNGESQLGTKNIPQPKERLFARLVHQQHPQVPSRPFVGRPFAAPRVFTKSKIQAAVAQLKVVMTDSELNL